LKDIRGENYKGEGGGEERSRGLTGERREERSRGK
jgi:hypothetical protein